MLPTIAHALTHAIDSRRLDPGVSTLSLEDRSRARAVLTHRRCAPEHAAYVRSRCLYDRDALPRWHQDDRGRSARHRGHHQVADEGAYSQIPAWNGRYHFLAFARLVALGELAVLKEAQVSIDTFLAYLHVRTGYVQHQRTGRRCIVRPDTLASVLDVSENTVHRCQRTARRLGLEVVVIPGRMLNVDECTAARRRGSAQRGLSTEVAFTIPRRHAALVHLVTPTRGRSSSPENRTFNSSPTDGASADKADATPSRPRQRGPAWHLARQVHDRLPWLATEAPGRCVPPLTRFALAPTPWTAEQILHALADDALRRGITHQLRAETIATRPAVVLAGLLRNLDEISDHPDAPAFALRPCARPDCDGHGWITVDANTVAPCPDCPRGLRGNNLEELDAADGANLGDENPF